MTILVHLTKIVTKLKKIINSDRKSFLLLLSSKLRLVYVVSLLFFYAG